MRLTKEHGDFLRKVEHLYLIDGELCKFYCTAVCQNMGIYLVMDANLRGESYSVFSIGYRCARLCSQHRGVELELIDYANRQHWET